MRIPRLFKTASFRLTFIYGLLLVATFLVLLAISFWTTTNALRDQIKSKIGQELTALSVEQGADGDSAIIQDISDRLKSTGASNGYYHFADSQGHILAGNISQMQLVTGWQEGSLEDNKLLRPIDASDQALQVWGEGQRLSNGSFLFVGQDAEAVAAAQATILAWYLTSGVLALSIALLSGIALSKAFLRRIDCINQTSQKIMAGELHERIPVGGTFDEIDLLSSNLNRLFDANVTLLESLKQMGTSIAHDLRSPLSRLRQGLEEARTRPLSVEHYRGAIDLAISDTDQILSTFSALLRISQVEAGTKQARFAECDLSAIVLRISEIYSAVAEDGGKSITCDVQPSLMVRGDVHLLFQMIANLIENAIKHTSQGSRIFLGLTISGTSVELIVSDNGPGVPESERSRIFERFYRVDRSRSTPGNGLGLALVAAIAQIHGITIEVSDNVPGLKFALHF